jgi:hypothetical protein
MAMLLRLFVAGCSLLYPQSVSTRGISFEDLPDAVKRLVESQGVRSDTFKTWMSGYAQRSRQRLEWGSVEHIVYFAMQSQRLSSLPTVSPARATASDASAALAKRRLEQFLEKPAANSRHALLRRWHAQLPNTWTPEKMLDHTLGFLREKRSAESPEQNRLLYQRRGLSEDSFPESTSAVEEALRWLQSRSGFRPPKKVLLLGPGMELGSRFGLNESLPIAGPQAASLRKLLGPAQAELHCADIRPEVVVVFSNPPCIGLVLDIVAARPAAPVYDLAVVTNVLVYLDDTELAFALSNLVAGLTPGGCLIHNDERFAVRVYGELVGAPVAAFLPIQYETRAGGLGVDRAVVHCRPATSRQQKAK